MSKRSPALESRRSELIVLLLLMEADRTGYEIRSLIREYLFVSVYRAFANSLASENASRLAAMQNAEKNIGERLEELDVQFHRQRQMTITEELLDIVAGFEVLKEARA